MNRSRLGCFTFSGIGAALITLALITGIGLAQGGAMFSPGGLNAQNEHGASLGGVTSHAELVDQCSACHTAPWSPVTMSDQCLACHTEIEADLQSPETLHGSVLAFTNPIQCRDCHTEHLGPESLLTSFDTPYFKHDVVGFSLEGHQSAYDGGEFACRDCHLSGSRFEASTCGNCHLDAEPDFVQMHATDFGTECLDCHDGIDTYGDSFDHAQTGFPLFGEHLAIACRDCHGEARSISELQAAPTECIDCHRQDDEHDGRFGEKCGVCHSPEDWDETVFDHSVTGYPLIGEHQEVKCLECHPGNAFVGTPTECAACHAEDVAENHYPGECSDCHTPLDWEEISFDHSLPQAQDCATCHTQDAPDNHFPGQCSDCHTTEAWSPATFKHDTVAVTDCTECHLKDLPPNHYTGQCSGCHTTQAWLPADFDHEVAQATDCLQCHLDDRPAGHYSGQCSACHSTQAWLPATFNHSAAGATDCLECHADDAPPNHYGGQCSACHNTNAWLPANFNHTAAGATDCISCHLADRPANHYEGQCSLCHSTSAWLPATFKHTFPTDHGGAGGNCDICHPNGPPGYTCYSCKEHDRQEIKKKHEEKGIYNYGDCVACHPDGRKGDD